MTQEEIEATKLQMLGFIDELESGDYMREPRAQVEECSSAFELYLATRFMYEVGDWRWQDTQRYEIWELWKTLAKDERISRVRNWEQ